MKLTKFVFDGEFIRIIYQKLEAEFAQNHPPTDDLPEVLVTCLVWGESAAVFKGVAPLPGGAEWQGLLTVTVGNESAKRVDFSPCTILPVREAPSPHAYRQKLRAIIEDSPSYDPALDLPVAQVGFALNELIARLEHLSQP